MRGPESTVRPRRACGRGARASRRQSSSRRPGRPAARSSMPSIASLGPRHSRRRRTPRRTTREATGRARSRSSAASRNAPRRRSALDDAGAELRGELVEQLGVGSQQLGGAGDRRHHVATGRLGERGQRLVPKALRSKAVIGVRLVDPGAQAQRSAARLGLVATHVEQRTNEVAGDGLDPGQPVEPPAAHERQQHRLGAIVHRVAERAAAGRRSRPATAPAGAVALLPRPPLDGVARAPAATAAGARGRPDRGRRLAARRRRRRPPSRAGARGRNGTPRARCGTAGGRARASRAGTRSRRRRRPTRASARRRGTSRGRVRSASRARSPARPPAAGARHGATPRRGRSSDRGRRSRRAAAGSAGPSQTRLKPLMPIRSTTSSTKRSPASYCATFWSKPIARCTRFSHPETARRRASAPRSCGRSSTTSAATLVHHDRRRAPRAATSSPACARTAAAARA